MYREREGHWQGWGFCSGSEAKPQGSAPLKVRGRWNFRTEGVVSRVSCVKSSRMRTEFVGVALACRVSNKIGCKL